jgi:predicted RNase H-like HicB family nuclease
MEDAGERSETGGYETVTRRYLVVVERGDSGCGAFSPDLPGCVATGRTPDVALSRMREAIAFHLDGLRRDGETIPEPRMTLADWVSVEVG